MQLGNTTTYRQIADVEDLREEDRFTLIRKGRLYFVKPSKVGGELSAEDKEALEALINQKLSANNIKEGANITITADANGNIFITSANDVGLKYKVVGALPNKGESGYIYLVGTECPYDTFIWASEKWVQIGTTDIDLSDFYTKTEVDGLLANLPLGDDNIIESISVNGVNISPNNKNVDIPVPTPPTVNDGTTTFRLNGENIGRITANQSDDRSIDIDIKAGEFDDSHLIPKSDFDGELSMPTGVTKVGDTYWRTSNVDLSTETGFATNPEDAGMFFQWEVNRGWRGLPSLQVQVWDNVNKKWYEDEWASPARTAIFWPNLEEILPKGYTLPTIQQLSALDISKSVWTFRNGVPGREFEGAPENLFFPAVGWISGGIYTNSGSSVYWAISAQPGSPPHFQPNAHSMQISRNHHMVSQTSRNMGALLRCVWDDPNNPPLEHYYSKIETDTSLITNKNGDCGIRKRSVYFPNKTKAKTPHEASLFFPQITKEQIEKGESIQSGTVSPKTIHDAIGDSAGSHIAGLQVRLLEQRGEHAKNVVLALNKPIVVPPNCEVYLQFMRRMKKTRRSPHTNRAGRRLSRPARKGWIIPSGIRGRIAIRGVRPSRREYTLIPCEDFVRRWVRVQNGVFILSRGSRRRLELSANRNGKISLRMGCQLVIRNMSTRRLVGSSDIFQFNIYVLNGGNGIIFGFTTQ